MTKKKKLTLIGIASAMVATLLFSFFVVTASPTDVKCGAFYLRSTSDDMSWVVAGTDGTENDDLLLPETFEEKPVIGVLKDAFKSSGAVWFYVPKSFTYFETEAFGSASSVFNIYLIGRDDLSGVLAEENWNNGGNIIFGNVYPGIIDNYFSSRNENFYNSENDNGNGDFSLFPDVPFSENNNSSLWGDDDKNTNPDKNRKPKPPNGDTVSEGDKVIPDHTIDGEDNPPAKRTLRKIDIKTPPHKIEYIEGQTFAPNGIVISGEYSDGTRAIITGASFPSEALVTGQTLVQITYEENEKTFRTSQSISVTRKIPVSLSVAVPPEDLTYIEGEAFDTSGLKTVASYNNGSSKNVIPQATTAPLSLGQGAVVLRYTENGKQVKAEQKVTVLKKIPVSLSITTPPRKTSYIEEDMFEDAGMVITATYNDGSKKGITAYTFEDKQLLKYQQTVLISYEEDGERITVDCPIVTIPKIPVKLKVKTPPTKTTYIEQEAFSPDGMVTTVTYNNGKSATVKSVSPAELLILGQTKVVVNYEEASTTVSCDVPITVLPAVPNSIKITRNPNQITYDAGRLFQSAGMVVKGVYSDGSEREVTGYTFPNVLLTQGQSNVVISYTYRGVTRTVNCPVTVGVQKYVYEKYTTTGTNPYVKYTSGAWLWSGSASCTGRPATGHAAHQKDKSGSIPSAKVYVDFTYSNGVYTTVGSAQNLEYVMVSPKRYAKHFNGNTCFFFTESYGTSTLRGYVSGSTTYCDPGGGGSSGDYRGLSEAANITSEYRNYIKGSYVGSVTAADGSLPNDGVSDSYWYVRTTAITDTILATLAAKKAGIEKPKVALFEKWTTLNNHKQTYLADVEVAKDTLPQNGLHSDGYWYVFKKIID